MFNEYSGTPGHSNALLRIPKGRLGPLVVWGVRGSCCGTLRKLCLTKQARFSQTAATRSGRFICHRQRSHRSPYERSSGALWYFLARKKVHYTYSKPCFNAKKTPPPLWWGLCSRYLSSRAVARQVLSAQMSLTSVFGMGTGGPSSQSTRTI